MKFGFSLFFIVACALTSFAQNDCLSRGQELFNEKEYILAEDVLKECLKQKYNDSDTLISIAGVQMILGKFNEAEYHFKTAAKGLPSNSPYIAYINSRLGDLAMRKASLKEAAFFYDAALKAEPANINALVGKGITEEKAGRTASAVSYFKKALAVDFTNVVARERLIAMEPDILSQEEILDTMKERNIVDPATEEFTKEDEDLLKKIIVAEKDNGIEYLSSKFAGNIPPGLVVERDSGKIYVRKMLTLTGYKELIVQLSRDAKQMFLSKNISPGDIFKLKDFDLKPVFDSSGNLTDEGLVVYTKALRDVKAYLLPGERLASTQREIDALAAKYKKQGYNEVSSAEFLHIQQETQCNEGTLVNYLKVKIVEIDAKHRRVFVLAAPDTPEPFNIPWLAALDYRRTLKEVKQQKAVESKGAFGLGGGVQTKLCKKDGSLSKFFQR